MISTGSGDVSLEHCGRTASLTVGSGDIRIGEVTGDAVAKTGSGDVEVDRLGGTLMTKSGSGDLVVRRATSGAVKANGASGSITIGVEQGTAAWLDVSTLTGRVIQELDQTGAPTDGQQRVEITATRERQPGGCTGHEGDDSAPARAGRATPPPPIRPSSGSAPVLTDDRSPPTAWGSEPLRVRVSTRQRVRASTPFSSEKWRSVACLVVHRGVGHRVAVRRHRVHLVAGRQAGVTQGLPRVAMASGPLERSLSA